MSTLYTQEITILRAGTTTDRYGNTRPDWTTPASTTIAGVNVQPEQSIEAVGAREVLTTSWRLYCPRGLDLDLNAGDRIVLEGRTLEVDGEVGRWPAPGGGLHHLEARLKAVSA